jgi:hypothetical protein
LQDASFVPEGVEEGVAVGEVVKVHGAIGIDVEGRDDQVGQGDVLLVDERQDGDWPSI